MQYANCLFHRPKSLQDSASQNPETLSDSSAPAPAANTKPTPLPPPKNTTPLANAEKEKAPSATETSNAQKDDPSEVLSVGPTSAGQGWLQPPNNKTASGVVAFLGSSSNINLLFEPQEEGDSFHYALPNDLGGRKSRLNELDNEELEILKFRGAFLLPPRDLCDDLIEAFFEKIYPTMPILNRSKFMRSYNSASNPPSLLLLQSMLLAGSRVCRNPALLDSDQSTDLASLTFYKRAKALFDANYETDKITIVQSVMLLSWWWEGPEDVTRNSFYWSRVALSIAQGFGLHRSMEKTNMPLDTKRTWKKMWWALFTRDRWGAVALGRPVLVNLEDSDVPMLTEDDFIEDEPGLPALYPVNRTHVLSFIHSVKLSEIMGMVLKQQFSINAEISRRQNRIPVVSHCDMAMGSWMNNLPPELKYSVKDKSHHNFFVATLHAQYYTVLCLVHRSNVLRKGGQSSNNPYPSWGIAFQAAHMISRIMESLIKYDEIKDCSVFYIYTVFSAMIMLLYQTDSPNPSVVESAKKGFDTCMVALSGMGKQWMVARMLQNLFKPLNSNKQLRDQYMNDSKKRKTGYTSIQDSNHTKKTKNDNTPLPSVELGHLTSQFHETLAHTSPLDQHAKVAFSSNSHNSSLRSTLANNSFSSSPDKKPSPSQSGRNNDSPSGSGGKWNKVPNKPNTPRGLRNASNLQTSPSSMDPDFLFVTNSPDSTSFYQNFQPSQLFPESNDSDSRPGFYDPYRSAESANSSVAGNTPPNMYAGGHGNGINNHAAFHSTQSSPNDETGSVDSKNTSSPAVYGMGHRKDSSGQRSGDESVVPSTLNLNDWYHYLTSTFQNVVPNETPAGASSRTDGQTPGGDQMITDLLNLG